MRSTLTRRGAIGAAAALGLASCGGDKPPPAGQPRAGSGVALLSSIVALEHAGIAAWATIGDALRGDARRYARTIREREVAHAARLAGLVRQAGGKPPEMRPAADYARLFPKLRTEADALHFARDLEERLVRAYLEALPLLPEREQRRASGAIAAEEAEDLAVVNALAGGPAAPQPFVTGIQ